MRNVLIAALMIVTVASAASAQATSVSGSLVDMNCQHVEGVGLTCSGPTAGVSGTSPHVTVWGYSTGKLNAPEAGVAGYFKSEFNVGLVATGPMGGVRGIASGQSKAGVQGIASGLYGVGVMGKGFWGGYFIADTSIRSDAWAISAIGPVQMSDYVQITGRLQVYGPITGPTVIDINSRLADLEAKVQLLNASVAGR